MSQEHKFPKQETKDPQSILKTALQDMQSAYGRLHDGLSDMIESGRLTEADIPDDYQWLVETLSEPCNVANQKAEEALRQEN